MPLQIVHCSENNFTARLAMWSDRLPEGLLISMLNAADARDYRNTNFHLDKRRAEWLRTRILLDHLAPGSRLAFLSNGKPMLNAGMHVSISHSGDMAAVVVSPAPVGIDVQAGDLKLERIQSRFCNADELDFAASGRSADKLAIIWAAKEAVFKYFGEMAAFAADMHVLPFDADDQFITLRYSGSHGTGTFTLMRLYWLGYHIVLTQSFTPVSTVIALPR